MYLKRQETVDFDPAKKEHRAAVAAFMQRRAWSDSPIRFTHDPQYGSVAEQVQFKLLNYYINREKLDFKVSPKVPETVIVATLK